MFWSINAYLHHVHTFNTNSVAKHWRAELSYVYGPPLGGGVFPSSP